MLITVALEMNEVCKTKVALVVKNLHDSIYSSFIHNCQKLEASNILGMNTCEMFIQQIKKKKTVKF